MGFELIRGGVASDGRIAGGATNRAGIGPSINLLIRREGTWSVAV